VAVTLAVGSACTHASPVTTARDHALGGSRSAAAAPVPPAGFPETLGLITWVRPRAGFAPGAFEPTRATGVAFLKNTDAVTGGLTPTEIDGVWAEHWHEIVACYSDAPPGGETPAVRVRFEVDLDGHVIAAAVADGSTTVSGRCVLGRLQSWMFPRPTGAVAQVDHTFILGGLSALEIRAVLKKHWSEIKQCAAVGLATGGSVTGAGTISVSIGESGAVIAAHIEELEPGDGDVESCMLKDVEQFTFPKPRGGGRVDVNVPYNLADAQQARSQGAQAGPND